MAVSEYLEVLDRASHLTSQEKVELLAELANQLRVDGVQPAKRSIKELRGLGKEIWLGIDAQEYVNRERDSWGG